MEAGAWPGTSAWHILSSTAYTEVQGVVAELQGLRLLTCMEARPEALQLTALGMDHFALRVTLHNVKPILAAAADGTPFEEHTTYQLALALQTRGWRHCALSGQEPPPALHLEGMSGVTAMQPADKRFWSLVEDVALRRDYLIVLLKLITSEVYRASLVAGGILHIPHHRSNAFYAKLLKGKTSVDVPVEFEDEADPRDAQPRGRKRALPPLRIAESFRWGAVTFVYKRHATKPGYQATCCRRSHVTLLTNGGRTDCTKTLHWPIGDEEAQQDVIRRLKYWAVKGFSYDTKSKHGKFTPKLQDTPTIEELERLLIPADREESDPEHVAAAQRHFRRPAKRPRRAVAQPEQQDDRADRAASSSAAAGPQPQRASSSSSSSSRSSSSDSSSSSSTSSG